MTDALFRPEVSRARAEAWLGTTRLPSPRIAWPATLLALALVAGIALFLAFGHVTRRVHAAGELVSSASGQLRVELRVAEADIGRIAPGTQVVLRYAAFPYRRDGVRFGRVAAIMPPATADSGAGDESRWRVLVAPDPPAPHARMPALPLRAGMRVDADLALERQRLYEAVFFPARRDGSGA